MRLSTDYLIAETDAEVMLVDRRPGAGGHWLDAYPFVRLHIPSAYYGVNSLSLGEDRIDVDGENAGFYERASSITNVGPAIERVGEIGGSTAARSVA